ncbi:MAG TPA: hypothetical protein DG577_06300 [Firmicutes bacterium]|mgnify:FL=1|jgi:ABC-2 type transport system ATP-binding protein|nr:hypothetical protein [Bacillota bacterium]
MNIESKGIKKAFKNNEVIKDFSFTIQGGRITCLLGPNGSGKTTWIRIALGLETADRGQVMFSGQPISQARNQVSIVFDEPPVYGHLSGYDNLYLLSRVDIGTQYVNHILSALNLEKDLMRKDARAFSLGQRHRLAVACALIRQGNFIIMDEPTVGLDVVSWEIVKNLLKAEAAQGRVVLLTGHNYDLMAEVVDDILIISEGTISYHGSMNNIIKAAGINVELKTQFDRASIESYGFTQIAPSTFHKQYSNRQEFNSQLVHMQKRGIIIEHIDIKVPGLKEVYQAMLENKDELP